MSTAIVSRISGPVVVATDIEQAQMYDVVTYWRIRSIRRNYSSRGQQSYYPSL